VALSKDGTLAITCDNALAILWEVSSGKVIRELKGHTDRINVVALSDNQKWLITGSWDRSASMWDLNTGKRVRIFRGDDMDCLAMSRDNRLLATGSWIDDTCIIWEIDSGKKLCVLNAPGISSVSFSGDGKLIAIGGQDSARILEIETGKVVHSYKIDRNPQSMLVLTSDCKLIATTGGPHSLDRKIRLWDVATGRILRVLNPQSEVWFLRLSNDEKWILASCRDGTSWVWDLDTGMLVKKLSRKTNGPIKSLAISNGGGLFAVGDSDGSPAFWDLRGGAFRILSDMPCEKAIGAITVSHDGKHLFIGERGAIGTDCKVRILGLPTKAEIRSISAHKSAITSAIVNKETKWIITCAGELFGDTTVRLWDLTTGNEIRCFQHAFTVGSIGITDDEKWLLTASAKEATLWEIATGKQVGTYSASNNSEVSAAAISSNGQFIVTSHRDKMLRFWHRSSNEPLMLRELKKNVTTISFSPEGKWLLTGSEDGIVQRWSLPKGDEVRSLCSHEARVTCMAVDGSLVFTGSADGCIRMCDLKLGKELCQMVRFEKDAWAVFDEKGNFDVDAWTIDGLYWVERTRILSIDTFKERSYVRGLLPKNFLGSATRK